MKFSFFPLIALFAFSLNGCSKKNDEAKVLIPPPTPPVRPVASISYDPTQLEYSTLFENIPQARAIQRQDYNELSGIAASQKNPGILYMHSDSRNAPIVLSNALGQDLGKIILDGQSSLDPEDIAVGPGPEAGKSYIYFGDIGDNNSTRGSITVYRFEEPLIDHPDAATEIHISQLAKIVLKYPTSAYNAETLLIDPLTKDIFIASKEVNRSTIYRAAYPQSETTTNTMEAVLEMRFFDLFTSGDISMDGKEIILRDKGQLWYWTRSSGQSLVDALLVAPKKAAYNGNEHQGEGVAFAADGSGYFTNTETRDYPGAVSNLSFYKRK